MQTGFSALTIGAALSLAGTAQAAPVQLVHYGNQSSPTPSRTDAESTAAGVSATDFTEEGDTNGDPGFQFQGASLFIKHSPLENSVDAADDGLSFSLTADDPQKLIELNSYRIDTNIDTGFDQDWGFKILVNGVEQARQPLTAPGNINPEQTYDISSAPAASTQQITVLFATSSNGPNTTFRISDQFVTGETVIPTPSTMAMGLGSLGLILLTNRRRRAG
jgi:hypothetical protein